MLFRSVFVGGVGDDLAPFRAWRTMDNPLLSELMSVISGAALFVGGAFLFEPLEIRLGN